MFDSIAVRRVSDYGKIQLDVGAICEALLYYKKIHLLLDPSTLHGLVSQIGLDSLLSLVSHRSVRAHYFDEVLSIHSNSDTGMKISSFEVVSYVSDRNKPIPEETLKLTLAVALKSPNVDMVAIRKFIGKFLRKVRVRHYSKLLSGGKGVTELADSVLEDDAYVDQSAKIALLGLVPDFSIPKGWFFRVIRLSDGFVMDTNFDFPKINVAYGKFREANNISQDGWFPEKITQAVLMQNLLETSSQIMECADYMSEVMTSNVVARTIRLRFSCLLQRADQNRKSIDSFQHLLLSGGRSIRSAINGGERSLSDFFGLLDKAERFKEWIGQSNPDEQLINEYVQAIARTSWMDRLPPRVIRFALFTGAGLLADALMPTGLGTIAGVSLGAGDSFLLDRLIKGWRPNQFVEGPLRDFLT